MWSQTSSIWTLKRSSSFLFSSIIKTSSNLSSLPSSSLYLVSSKASFSQENVYHRTAPSGCKTSSLHTHPKSSIARLAHRFESFSAHLKTETDISKCLSLTSRSINFRWFTKKFSMDFSVLREILESKETVRTKKPFMVKATNLGEGASFNAIVSDLLIFATVLEYWWCGAGCVFQFAERQRRYQPRPWLDCRFHRWPLTIFRDLANSRELGTKRQSWVALFYMGRSEGSDKNNLRS